MESQERMESMTWWLDDIHHLQNKKIIISEHPPNPLRYICNSSGTIEHGSGYEDMRGLRRLSYRSVTATRCHSQVPTQRVEHWTSFFQNSEDNSILHIVQLSNHIASFFTNGVPFASEKKADSRNRWRHIHHSQKTSQRVSNVWRKYTTNDFFFY